MSAAPDFEPDPKTAYNEKVKATAGYLNGIAGGLFAAGVIAPGVAAVFGVTGAFGPVPTLTLAGGIAMFFGASVAVHLAARRVLDRVRK